MIELVGMIGVLLAVAAWLVKYAVGRATQFSRELRYDQDQLRKDLNRERQRVTDDHETNMRWLRAEHDIHVAQTRARLDAYSGGLERYTILNGIASSEAPDEQTTEAPEEAPQDPIKEFGVAFAPRILGRAVVAGDPVATDAVRDILKL